MQPTEKRIQGGTGANERLFLRPKEVIPITIRARRNGMPALLYQQGFITCPLPEPPKPVNDQRPECEGYPYPRHGLSCSGPDGCLYLDMQKITARKGGPHAGSE